MAADEIASRHQLIDALVNRLHSLAGTNRCGNQLAKPGKFGVQGRKLWMVAKSHPIAHICRITVNNGRHVKNDRHPHFESNGLGRKFRLAPVHGQHRPFTKPHERRMKIVPNPLAAQKIPDHRRGISLGHASLKSFTHSSGRGIS